MKRITVGRGNDCDIVIVDDTDNISRHHLVISFNLMGKMNVSDTSSNGTFINGTKMLKGVSIPVTVNDKIRLGKNIELDWGLVKDPYKTPRLILIASLITLIILSICLAGWFWYKDSKSQSDTYRIELINTDSPVDDNWNQDSTNKVAPVVTSIEVANKKKTATKEVKRKKKEVEKVYMDKKTLPTTHDNSALDSVAIF